MATRKLVEQVTARVFCHGPGGGNPVTVFASQHALSSSSQERLAKDCEWESVMVSTNDDDDDKKLPEMAFYMPSGEEVSFCAHAALGGAYAVASKTSTSEFSFQTQMTKERQLVQLLSSSSSSQENDADSMAARLYMKAAFEESPVSHSPSLQRLLREHLGVTSQHLAPLHSGGKRPPTFVNSSIARPKTLVHLNSMDALGQAKTPSVSSSTKNSELQPQKQRTSFATACGAIDDSTGIYLYADKKDEEDGAASWECRQFPRASGYPEDPATGIAAAALAASLYHQGVYLPVYNFYQGTTMGRPSLIQVLDMKMDGTNICFGLQGRVEIDHRDTIELDDD